MVEVHRFETRSYGQMRSNDRGEILDRKKSKRLEYISRDVLQLNHYYTRSAAELEMKLCKGSAAQKNEIYRKKTMHTVERIEVNEVTDLTALTLKKKLGLC